MTLRRYIMARYVNVCWVSSNFGFRALSRRRGRRRVKYGTKRGALRSYRSRMIFGAVWDRDMVSALEHAGAVELSMRSWRFISGRRRCAVDRLEGPRSRRHEVVVSSCFGLLWHGHRHYETRLRAPRRRRGAPLRLGGPISLPISMGREAKGGCSSVGRRRINLPFGV